MTPHARWLRWMAVILALTAVFWTLATWPGEILPDTRVQYLQGAAGAYTNAHPALLSWLLGRSVASVGNTGPLLSSVMMIAALGLWGLADTVPRARGARAAFVALALFPLGWAQLASVLKDAWSLALLLMALALLSARRPWFAAIVTALMCCFRHNSIAMVPALAGFAAWPLRHAPGRAVATAMGVIGLSLATPRLVDRVLDVGDGHPAVPSLIFDVAGVYLGARQAYDTGPYAQLVDYAEIKKRYTPKTARYLTSDVRGLPGWRHGDIASSEQNTQLKREWVRVVTTWPGAWARHRLQVAARYFSATPFEPYYESGKDRARILPMSRRRGPLWQAAHTLRAAVRWSGNGLLWGVATLVLGLFAVRRRDALGITVFLVALGNEVANVLAAPSTPFRYHVPCIVAVLVLFPRTFWSTTEPSGN
ncbi:MAG: hypothetical protein EXR71_12665 [Myxococcales bacterium]|nr:hypothetical protein [Myxococcales bacterium]